MTGLRFPGILVVPRVLRTRDLGQDVGVISTLEPASEGQIGCA